MNRIDPLRISIIGAGKVAKALCRALSLSGVEIVEIYNRTRIEAEKLAAELDNSIELRILTQMWTPLLYL
jgi:glutamyl-tRNA reductase